MGENGAVVDDQMKGRMDAITPLTGRAGPLSTWEHIIAKHQRAQVTIQQYTCARGIRDATKGRLFTPPHSAFRQMAKFCQRLSGQEKEDKSDIAVMACLVGRHSARPPLHEA